MNHAASNWVLVFKHDTAGGYFSDYNQAASVNADRDPNTVDLFSRLDELENFRDAEGNFHFMLIYPELGGEVNEWKQSSNPMTSVDVVENYQAIRIAWTDQYWGGLARSSTARTFIDGSVGHENWFYSIGSLNEWGGGVPGPDKMVERVELYVRRSGDGDAPTAAVVFAGQSLGGASVELGVGEYEQGSIPIGEHNISSIRVIEGFEAALFEGPRLDGAFMVAPAGDLAYIGDDFDNRVRSLQVRAVDAPGAGGEWALVFKHDTAGGYFSDDDQAMRFNADRDPDTVDLFSRLDELENFRDAEGKLHFKLVYPELGEEVNEWKQSSNPLTCMEAVGNYQAIRIAWSEKDWGGLSRSSYAGALIDGGVGHDYWFYCIGAKKAWGEGMPGPGRVVKRVELYAWRSGAGASDPLKTTVYTQPDFWGRRAELEIGDYEQGSIPIGEHNIASIEVPAGLEAVLFRGRFLDGDYEVVHAGARADVGALKGAIGSLQVRAVDAAGAGDKWVLVFKHDAAGGFFNDDNQAASVNADADPRTVHLFSRLDELEKFRDAEGNFHFKLVYPELTENVNEWKQSSNPMTSMEKVEKYRAIRITWTSRNWGGLARSSDARTLIHGGVDQGDSYYSIGSNTGRDGGIPGPDGTVGRVEFYVLRGGAGLAPAPLLHLPLVEIADGKTPDLSENAFDCMVEGNPRVIADDRFGRCMWFDFGDAIVTRENIPISGDQARTITFWFKKRGGEGRFVMLGDTSRRGGNCTIQSRGEGLQYWGHYSDFSFAEEGININEWIFLAVTCEGSRFKAYINGASPPVEKNIPLLDTVTAPMKVAEAFEGPMAHVRIYSRVLGPEQIGAIMRADACHLDFALEDDGERNVLYITDSVTVNEVRVEIGNISGRGLVFSKTGNDAASGDNRHVELLFTPGTFVEEPGDGDTFVRCKTLPDHWAASRAEKHADGKASLHLLYMGEDDFTLDPDDKLVFTLEHRGSEVMGGARETEVELVYENIRFQDDNTPLAGVRIKSVDIRKSPGLDDRLVLHLPLVEITDGKTPDLSENAFECVLRGEPRVVADDRFGRCMWFDGNDDKIVIEENVPISGDQARTITFWFKKKSRDGRFFMLGADNHRGGICSIQIRGGNLQYWGHYSDFTFAEREIETNEWIFLAVTCEGSEFKAHLNGDPTPIEKNIPLLDTVTAPLTVGRTFRGRMAHFRIYSRVLSFDQMTTIMQADPCSLDLTLEDDGERDVLYITDSGIDNEVRVEIENISEKSLVFPNTGNDAASADNRHVELLFTPGTFVEELGGGDKFVRCKTLPYLWAASRAEKHADDKLSLHLLYMGEDDCTLNPGDKLVFTLEYRSSEVMGGTRETEMELVYENIRFQDDDTPLAGVRIKRVEIQNIARLAPPPLLHLPLVEIADGKTPDRSANKLDGTMSGDPEIIWDDRFGRCMKFDGVDDKIVTGDNVPILGSQARTITFWFRKESGGGSLVTLGDSSRAGGAFSIRTSDGRLDYWGHYSDFQFTDNVVTDDEWIFLAATCDGSRVEVLLNGNAAPVGVCEPVLDTVAAPMTVADGLNGRMADVRVYRQALNQDQINAVMQAGPCCLDFSLEDDGERDVLYITDGGMDNEARVEIENITGRSQVFPKTGNAASSADNHHLALLFEPGTFIEELGGGDKFVRCKTLPDHWAASRTEKHANGKASLHLLYTGEDDFTLAPGDKLVFTLEYRSSEVMGGARETEVELVYENIRFQNDNTPLAGVRIKRVEIQNIARLAPPPLLHLPLVEIADGKTPDRSTNELNGVVEGDPRIVEDDRFGRCMRFSDKNDGIVTKANVPISGNQARTMTLWFKREVADSGPVSLIVLGANSRRGGVCSVRIMGNNLQYFGHYSTFIFAEDVIEHDDWMFLTVTCNGSEFKAFLNGDPTPIEKEIPLLDTVAAPMTLADKFRGRMAHVRIYSQVLNQDQISAVMRADAVDVTPPRPSDKENHGRMGRLVWRSTK